MTLQEFIAALNTKFVGKTFATDKSGVKYTRVICERSAYCFIDADGNIYKAASWKTPAKGIRATLATLDMSKVDQYGGWLYR